jgi:DNA-binding NarL/FixJ family response regulator
MARILIVDDSVVMRRNLKTLLEEAGHTVVGEAINGQQAYFKYKETLPDLVTMDITMPKVDGIDAVKKIIDNFPVAKIIMISALDQKSKVFSALRNGAKHYIIKPITAEKTNEIIQMVLNQKTNPDVIIAEPKLDEVAENAYSVKSDKGSFIISISRDLEIADLLSLESILQGFLVVNNLSIIFEFDYFSIKGDEGLTKFNGLVHRLINAKTNLEINTKLIDFKNQLIKRNPDFDSVFKDEGYKIT